MKIGETNCSNDTKHNRKYSSNDWFWNSDKQGPNLAANPDTEKDDCSILDDSPAAHLGDPDGPDVLAVAGGPVPSPPHPGQDAAETLHGNPPVDGVDWRRRGA